MNITTIGIDLAKNTLALDLLEEAIVPLTSVPGSAGTRGVKRLILRRFLYSVIVFERDTEILVIAFAHHARRPGYWRDRTHKDS